MSKNKEIENLSYEIIVDISEGRLPLHIVLLKASRLALLLDMPGNVQTFKEWANFAEQNQFVVQSFEANIQAASDRQFSFSGEWPGILPPMGNGIERHGIREEAKKVAGFSAKYRTEVYQFVVSVYTKWKFGDIAETIFERKRKKTEPFLRAIFPDVNQRLNSIEQNIKSDNSEDWKNAVTSCRTLIADMADILNPAKTTEDKDKFISRLKSFVTSGCASETYGKLINALSEETHKRIKYTSDLTQGGAHQIRPTLDQAENVVLYTYLLLSDLMEIYSALQTAPGPQGQVKPK